MESSASLRELIYSFQTNHRKVGLLCNQTAFLFEEKMYLMDWLAKEKVLKTIFVPEHGLFSELQDQEALENAEIYHFWEGVNCVSLYGHDEQSLKVSPEQVEELDDILIDIQDVGCRYFTYITTIAYLFETISRCQRPPRVWVIDHPNPAGRQVEGSPISVTYASFIGHEGLLHRHGLTLAPQLRQLEEAFNPARSGISEAVVPPGSRFVGKTIGELRLRKRYGISPLALTRGEEVYREDIRKVVVQAGDCLVFHSGWPELAEHVHERDFVVITDFPQDEHRPQKLWYAVIFFALGYGLALVGHFPLSVALLAGAVGMLLTGVLSMDEAYRAISWKTIFVLACLIPLGAAVDNSGTAAWLSQQAFAYLDGWPIWLLQLAIALLSAMAAMAISQIGATVLMVPMAINLALAANASPLEFALIAALGASNNFLTVSNAVNSLISGPGSYRPRDFLRIGLPLTVLFALLSVALVSWLF